MNRIKFGCKIQPFQVVRVEGGGEGGGPLDLIEAFTDPKVFTPRPPLIRVLNVET